jgi:hypothetical protein
VANHLFAKLIALAIAVTGTWVAIRSVRLAPPDFEFVGMRYSRFLLVMFTEVASYTAFVVIGTLTRSKPKIHRNAMLMAGLCLLIAATVRIPFLYPVFGTTGWFGLFGPVFCLGAALLGIRCLVTRSFDRRFALGLVAWVIAFTASEEIALSEAWAQAAAAIL